MKMIHSHSSPVLQSGYSYVEVLIATVLVVVGIIPALDALQSGIQATDIHETSTIDQYAVQSKMEELLTLSYSSLKAAADAAGDYTIPTSFTDTYTTTDGRDIWREVFISAYDGDNADLDNDPFTGTDAGLLWVQVKKRDTVIRYETLVKQ